MARSLARNTRLVVSTLGPAQLTPAGATTFNTFEVKVLDGYSFSQDPSTQEIGVSEAGTAPARGTIGFNTALNPVDVSFGTYVRSYDDGANANCTEKPLWSSAMGTQAGFTNSPDADTTIATFDNTDTETLTFSLGTSNNNELMKLYLYFILENTTYVVEDFNVSTAEVDFSIDGIAMINWSGFGSRLYESEDVHSRFTDDGDADYLLEGGDYLGVPATTTTTFLRNKLSTLDLSDNKTDTPIVAANVVTGVTGQDVTATGTPFTADELVGGRAYNSTEGVYATIIANTTSVVTISDATDVTTWNGDSVDYFTSDQHAGVVYSIPITGATITLENNMSYLTPEELAIVNLPLAGFAGTRSVSGSLTAYLNTGASGTGGLLADLLEKIEEVSNDFNLVFHMGNNATTAPRVDFTIPHAQISIPSTNVEDVISTEISFTGTPFDTVNQTGSFEDTNELTVTYKVPV